MAGLAQIKKKLAEKISLLTDLKGFVVVGNRVLEYLEWNFLGGFWRPTELTLKFN